ncbi:MAG: polysaccharide deacetylase family protein [Syntrophales bacterium]
MRNKKKILSAVVHSMHLIRFLSPVIRPRLIVFNYHRIRSDNDTGCSLYDDDVFGPTAASFREQMNWLKRYIGIISEDELIEYLNFRAFPPGINVLITFDDGYIDNYKLAFPILKELGIPAIFFVPTYMINTRQLGWWDILAYIIKNTASPDVSFAGRSYDLRAGRSRTIRTLQSIMRTLRPAEISGAIEYLARACRVPLPDHEEQGSQLMTWKHIREVSDNGIRIGSHTHTHRSLSFIRPQEQLEEMVVSKYILERKTGAPVKSIAYPIGDYRFVSRYTAELAEKSGYEAGFSFNTGINIRKIDRYDIKRIHVFNGVSMLSAAIMFPRLFTWK